LRAIEQLDPRIQELRRRFLEIAKSLDPMHLVFIDEAGSHIGMTRDYARAPCGERALGTVPRNRGDVTTMIGALDIRGVRAMMTVEGATDAEVFETFLERVLLRKLRPGESSCSTTSARTSPSTCAASSSVPARERCTCRRTRPT
jgi:hypothetical protein